MDLPTKNPPAAISTRSGRRTVVLLGFYFLLLFFAYSSTQGLETTINSTLGFWSLSILFLFSALSTFFSSHVVRNLGVSHSLVIGGACFTIYLAANIFPYPVILLPASAIVGTGDAILWNAQGVALTRCSDVHSIHLHSGLFWGISLTNLFFGNIFEALFLSYGFELEYLFIVLTIICGVATLLFFTIRVPPPQSAGDAVIGAPSLYETILIFKNQAFMCMICSSIYSGLSQSLFYGSFTSLMDDPTKIGFVMSAFGLADCLGALFNGWMAPILGKRMIIVIGSLSVLVGCFLSTMTYLGHDDPILLFATALLFGYADSAYNTQLNAIFATLFTSNAEPYFAGLKLLQASSAAAAFFYSSYLPYPFVTLIALFFMSVGLVTLFTLHAFVSPVDIPFVPPSRVNKISETSSTMDITIN